MHGHKYERLLLAWTDVAAAVCDQLSVPHDIKKLTTDRN